MTILAATPPTLPLTRFECLEFSEIERFTLPHMPKSPPSGTPATELPYWIAWAALQLPPEDGLQAWKHFGKLSEAWSADRAALQAANISLTTTATLLSERSQVDIDSLVGKIADAGMSVCTLEDPDYPPLLSRIHRPPLVLFYRGRIANLGPTVAVVGTRQASDYGLQMAWEISRELAAAGITIISGLALGIDTRAHQATLTANGKTVAVLGGGADARTVYPPSNRKLAETVIAQGGAVISEYPPGTLPLPYRFPERNRIIAGIARGTLVIEAPYKSGALITAKIAAEENRDVFAVPGRVTDANAAGPLALIASGATPVTNAADITSALGLALPKPKTHSEIFPAEPHTPAGIILALLSEPLQREELQRTCHLAPDVLSATLTVLEVNGAIQRLPSGKFYRTGQNVKLET